MEWEEATQMMWLARGEEVEIMEGKSGYLRIWAILVGIGNQGLYAGHNMLAEYVLEMALKEVGRCST